ncbi:DMT family transporter [Streptomyces olivaceus]|uniref:DMT family transporter n=1 Tax=Streptomyces olivaceus TaxID=47716 RepID=UPI00405724BE
MRTKLDAVSVVAVLVAVVAFSTTGPFTAYATAPALTLALGRNALGLLTLGPVFTLIRRREVRRIFSAERPLVRKEQRRAVYFSLLAGTALAVHFATFMISTRMTTVAMATALVATQPVWQALIATLQKNRLPRVTWVGLAVSVAGAAVASGMDMHTGTEAVVGDLLALAGAVASAVYAALSEKARPDVSTPMYSVLCFSVCTVELLILCLATGTPIFTSTAETWIALLGLLIFPQLLGLFSLNFAFGRAPATAVSVMLLLESPAAALIAWLWLDELPAGSAWPGLLMIMLGVSVVVVADTRRANPTADGPGGATGFVMLSQQPLLTLNSAPGGDVHALLWREANAGRFEQVEATIGSLENQAIRAHGAKSSEATHWLEVRAVVARIAGDPGLSARLWLAAARFHLSAPRPDLYKTRACLDRAFHEWCDVEDSHVVGELASALREMYENDPEHRPGVPEAIERRLLHLGIHSVPVQPG